MKKLENLVDLHVHTHYSDGDHSPEFIVNLAKKQGLKAVSVTDHDTTKGIKEALEAAGRYGLEVLPGIEISANYNRTSVHILGFFKADENLYERLETIESALKKSQDARTQRTLLSAEKCQAEGFKVTPANLKSAAEKSAYISRSHLALFLYETGQVQSVNEALFLTGKGGVAYVPYLYTPSTKEAISMIVDNGGVAFVSHPNGLLKKINFEDFLKEQIGYGLSGIEVYSSKHTKEQEEGFIALAQKYNILMSGGTDYHGNKLKPQIELGKTVSVPYTFLERIKSQLGCN